MSILIVYEQSFNMNTTFCNGSCSFFSIKSRDVINTGKIGFVTTNSQITISSIHPTYMLYLYRNNVNKIVCILNYKHVVLLTENV